MKKILGLAVFTILLFTVRVEADFVDFEDLKPQTIPAVPFTSGGLDFVSTHFENAIFPSGLTAADNGTQIFGWCGSGCIGTQLITATASDGNLFDVLSIDAGNLALAGQPLGYVEGMTVELVGNLDGGGTVSQSLLINENVFTTYALEGFIGLNSFEITAPEVLPEGGLGGTPDAVIDNIVWNTNVVPEPGTSAIAVITALGLLLRRRQR